MDWLKTNWKTAILVILLCLLAWCWLAKPAQAQTDEGTATPDDWKLVAGACAAAVGGAAVTFPPGAIVLTMGCTILFGEAWYNGDI